MFHPQIICYDRYPGSSVSSFELSNLLFDKSTTGNLKTPFPAVAILFAAKPRLCVKEE